MPLIHPRWLDEEVEQLDSVISLAQTVEPPILSTPVPQYGVMDFANDAGRAAGQ